MLAGTKERGRNLLTRSATVVSSRVTLVRRFFRETGTDVHTEQHKKKNARALNTSEDAGDLLALRYAGSRSMHFFILDEGLKAETARCIAVNFDFTELALELADVVLQRVHQ